MKGQGPSAARSVVLLYCPEGEYGAALADFSEIDVVLSAVHAACGSLNDENRLHLLHSRVVPQGCWDTGRLSVVPMSPPISLT